MAGRRRLPDETYAATARREVHEETGWLIEEPDLRLLGFIHMRHTRPQPGEHDRGQGDNWVDLDGRELGHCLATPKELAAVELSAAQRAFLNVLQDSGAP